MRRLHSRVVKTSIGEARKVEITDWHADVVANDACIVDPATIFRRRGELGNLRRWLGHASRMTVAQVLASRRVPLL